MASYMVYKPASAMKLTKQRLVSPFNASQSSETSSMRQEDSCSLETSRTVNLNLTPSPRQNSKRFDHNIPDHVLQAWPVVYDVHSKKQEEERELAAAQKRAQSTSLLTRRTTRTHSGIYRSSVITPGELEFMARKRQAWRRSNTHPGIVNPHQRPMMTSYSGIQDSEQVFVTQDFTQDCDMYREIQSRLTDDGRAKIVPSTIEVTLPGLGEGSRRSRRRIRRNEANQSQTGSNESETKNRGSQQQNLLSRHKTEPNNIRRRSPGEIRRKEELRQEQQFVLQPTTLSNPEWYESNGLKTPTVLQKYLTDTFYTAPPKTEIHTSALLNYIRDKQTSIVYVPPPPSSGSGCDDEKDDPPPLTAETILKHNSYDNELSIKQNAAVYSERRFDIPVGGRQTEKSLAPPRRTQKGNGGLDLTIGGGKIHQKAPTSPSNDQDNNMGSSVLDKLEHSRDPVRDALTQERSDPVQNLTGSVSDPKRSMEEHNGELLMEEKESEHDAEGNVPNAEHITPDPGEGKSSSDGTKRITVVLPSSESPRLDNL